MFYLTFSEVRQSFIKLSFLDFVICFASLKVRSSGDFFYEKKTC